jgi:CheY-like chemotaxis protein
MALSKIVLVVSPTPSVAQGIAAVVQSCGYRPVVTKGFAEAKKQLESLPHLVVTELKLAEYNGLHLALRAKLSDIPAIVVADRSYEHEVEHNGATWISPAMVLTGELESRMLAMVQGVGADATFAWYEENGQRSEMMKWHPPTSLLPH